MGKRLYTTLEILVLKNAYYLMLNVICDYIILVIHTIIRIGSLYFLKYVTDKSAKNLIKIGCNILELLPNIFSLTIHFGIS